MSTSLVYHGFGAVGYTYLKSEYRNGKIYFHIEKKPEYQYCVDCKSRNVTKKGCVNPSLPPTIYKFNKNNIRHFFINCLDDCIVFHLRRHIFKVEKEMIIGVKK